MSSAPSSEYLQDDFFVDAGHAAVAAFAEEHGGSGDARARVVSLYYAIRDGFRYNPWGVELEPAAFRASAVIERNRKRGGHCIDKANVLAACARHLGIPSRLHFANVRNHIGTEELQRQLGTDLLVFHGYTELFVDERWVAATPAFNAELCEHLGVAPLEFDGRSDSIFQQFDRQGGRFMEYVEDHGTFASIPYDRMIAEWKKHYPQFGTTNAWPHKT